jgi:hypothetical protein
MSLRRLVFEGAKAAMASRNIFMVFAPSDPR